MSARELGWALLGVCSTLGCARDGVAASPEPAKPIAVSVAPPVASAQIESAPSEPPAPPVELGDRMTLYGLSMALPSPWRDQTTPAFESESGPFKKIVITDEPELIGHAEEWLSATREKLQGFYGAQHSAIRRYEHSELEIRGFSMTFLKSAESVHVLVTAGAEKARHWHVICHSNCEAALGDLLRSLRQAKAEDMPSLDPMSLPTRKYVYRVYEWEFETSETLSNPREFWVESPDGKGRMWCERADEPVAFETPEWSSRFSLAYDAVLSPVVEVDQTIVGRPNPPLEAPVFATRHGLLTAHESGASRALTYAQATTAFGNAFFSCTFAREGAHRESLALWNAMLSSARRD